MKRFRFRVRTMLVLVLVAGLIAWRVTYRPRVHRGIGGGGGAVWANDDGDVELDIFNMHCGTDAAAWPIRWTVTVARIGQAEPFYREEFGRPSVEEPGGMVFTSVVRKTLRLKLERGDYWVSTEARDGLKVRDAAGKIVARAMEFGTSAGYGP
jgi:hypothetical protein